MSRKTIEVPILARVEGEGALDLVIENNQISQCDVRIYEPPRYFEKFLEGRHPNEIIDAVARICGICPLAYQISVMKAMEKAFDIQTNDWIERTRQLMYCGEWMESHYLHAHMLAAPDFLQYNSALEMAKDYPDEVKRGMRVQRVGNKILKLLGGRSVHPGGNKLGGFYRAPLVEQVKTLIPELEQARQDAIDTIGWFSTFQFPKRRDDINFVSLSAPNDYPMVADRIISSSGLDIPIQEYDQYFSEYQVPHSTAKHSFLQGKPYLLGPLARLNLNFDKLPKSIQDVACKTGVNWPSNNMFHSILARAIEGLWCIERALDICRSYVYPDRPDVNVSVKASQSWGASEAPRGIQIDYFEFDNEGKATKINIIPPTSQNLACIEADLRHSLTQLGFDRPDDEIRQHAEMVIRNYDPCISCSTHFLKLNLERK